MIELLRREAKEHYTKVGTYKRMQDGRSWGTDKVGFYIEVGAPGGDQIIQITLDPTQARRVRDQLAKLMKENL